MNEGSYSVVPLKRNRQEEEEAAVEEQLESRATTPVVTESHTTNSFSPSSDMKSIETQATSEAMQPLVSPNQSESRIAKLKSLCMTDDVVIQQEMYTLEKSFKNLSKEYCLVDKIGEGTFSSVYKAIDLKYHQHKNDWDTIYNTSQSSSSVQFVALKRIYVTSSPRRILNELKLLHKLSDSIYIAPIITALRHQDQIMVVLPYFQHMEFRNYSRYLTHAGIRRYMSDLLCGLEFIHSKRIIHRDIKPANFLFDPIRGYGVLVDFGLAEMETDSNTCACTIGGLRKRINHVKPQKGYKKEDRRPGRHANRAGTRGFRAPEVLYRCTNQTTKIDMWSVGVILLSILTRRAPFFNSTDDEDALIELATIWGKQLVNNCALLHGLVFESTVPNIPDSAYDIEDIVGCFSGKPTKKNEDGTDVFDFDDKEAVLLDLLNCILELNFKKRYSATQCLTHPFFDTNDDVSAPLLDKKQVPVKKRYSDVQPVAPYNEPNQLNQLSLRVNAESAENHLENHIDKEQPQVIEAKELPKVSDGSDSNKENNAADGTGRGPEPKKVCLDSKPAKTELSDTAISKPHGQHELTSNESDPARAPNVHHGFLVVESEA